MHLKIEDGALVEVPCYEKHIRSKNWLATISPDPSAPGGLSRSFQDRGRGRYYYLVGGLSVGDAVEFGADYYTGSGSKRATRRYGVVRSITPDGIEIEEFDTAMEAMKATAAPRSRADEIRDRLAQLESEKDLLLAELEQMEQEGGVEPESTPA